MATNSKVGSKYPMNRPSNIILPRAKILSVQSIKTWKDAITLAQLPEEPNRLPLLQIYESILIDGHLESIIESRVLRVLSSKFKFVNDKGEENKDLNTLFKRKWFIQFLSHAMWARFMGTTVVELWDLDNEMNLSHVGLIPRENLIPRSGIIAKEVGDQKGYPYKEGALVQHYIQIGDNDDLGKLAKAAPDPLTKKYAKAAWAEYVEKYGIPPRVVTTDSHNDTRHQELADMLASMVSSHWAVLQGSEKLEMMNTQGVDAHSTFDMLIQRMNSEMSKRILGQDGTTDSKDTKGTFGSLKVMQEVADDRHESDKTFIEYLINDELLWRLQLISGVYSGLANHRFEWDDSKELSPEEIVKMAGDLSTAGYVVDPAQIEEKTGLKIIGRTDPTPPDPNKPTPGQGEKKKPKLDANYEKDITTYYGNGHGSVDPTASASLLQKELISWARDIYYDNDAKPLNWNITDAIANSLLKALIPSAKVKAVDGFEAGFLSSLQSNIYVFSAAKTYAQYAEINALLVDELGNPRDFQTFKDAVLKIDEKYNLQYLKTEYNNALRTSQMAGKWKTFEAQKDLFDLRYNTAGDSKVRKDHKKLDGITLPVDHPFWNKNVPPLDFGCRCGLRQVAKGTAITPDINLKGLPKAPKMFQFNPGKQALIYSNEHPYIKSMTKDVQRDLQGVKDYGLKEVRAIYAKGTTPAKAPKNFTSKEKAENWFKAKAKDRVVTLKARLIGKSINVSLEQSRFNHIIKDGNKQSRWQWIGRLPSILQNANEVYLLDYKKRGSFKTYRFIKYYKDKILVSNIEIKDEKFRVITAYESTFAQIESQREGVLVSSK